MQQRPRTVRQQRGMTLIELIVVIVLIGILSAGMTQFLGTTVRGYVDTARRDQLASVGRIAVERMTRELRHAMPNSARVSNDCIEFLEVAASAIYQDRSVDYGGGVMSQPASVAAAAPAAAMDVFDFSFAPTAGVSYYVAIYPLNPTGGGANNPYSGSNPGVVASYAGHSAAGLPAGVSRIALSTNHRFTRHSPQRRAFIVRPVSFCVVGNRVNRYQNYALTTTQPTPPAPANPDDVHLVAERVQLNDGGTPVSPFVVLGQGLQRNAIVALDLRFMEEGEWVRFNHEVQLRNVP